MKEKILKLFKSEGALYLIFGVLTTFINYAVFISASKILGYEKVLISNTLAFIAAVIFAFFTNKIFVFKSKSFEFKKLFKEILIFSGARIFSYLFEQLGFYIGLNLLFLQDYKILGIEAMFVLKIILTLFVIFLNFIFSKFVVFKK